MTQMKPPPENPGRFRSKVGAMQRLLEERHLSSYVTRMSTQIEFSLLLAGLLRGLVNV